MKKYITESGKKQMAEKLLRLEKEIKDIQEEKAIAYVSSGDGWHDNPGFNQLEQKEHRWMNDFVELKNKLENMVVWDPSKNRKDVVQIGTIVEYEELNIQTRKQCTRKFELAGVGETNLKEMKISYDSPIGNALMGKKVGDTGSYQIPLGFFEIEIIEIE